MLNVRRPAGFVPRHRPPLQCRGTMDTTASQPSTTASSEEQISASEVVAEAEETKEEEEREEEEEPWKSNPKWKAAPQTTTRKLSKPSPCWTTTHRLQSGHPKRGPAAHARAAPGCPPAREATTQPWIDEISMAGEALSSKFLPAAPRSCAEGAPPRRGPLRGGRPCGEQSLQSKIANDCKLVAIASRLQSVIATSSLASAMIVSC